MSSDDAAVSDATPPCIIPRITTLRLELRELRATDFDAYAAFMAGPEAMRFMSAIPDRRTAWRALSSMTGAWLLLGAGWWAVELLATGELIGTVGAFFRETSRPVTRDSDLEVGWRVFPAHWRNGYASEAAGAALAYGFARQDVRRAIAHVDPGNIASIGVTRAIGMTYDTDVDLYGAPLRRYVVARRDGAPIG